MIHSFSLSTYRNITDATLTFKKKGALFVGDNGQGKTNLIEALYFFSIGKPFRLDTPYEAIQESSDFSELELNQEIQDKKTRLTIRISNSPRKQIAYFINDKKKSWFDFLGQFQAVLFSPKDMNIVFGSPSIRRDYIDSLLIRQNKQYALELKKYEKIIKQRNSLLKSISTGTQGKEELDIWDTVLSECAEHIWEKREELVQILQNKISSVYQHISGDNQNILHIEYSQKRDSHDMITDLKKRREKDIIIGSTSLGPHRDDFVFFLNHSPFQGFASQGETRSLVLALKFLEVELIESACTIPPVLLLDDVFSELDLKRQACLLELTKNHQTFFTTTHSVHLESLPHFIVKHGDIQGLNN